MNTDERRQGAGDRRGKPVDFRRRKYNRREREFVYVRDIYFSDTTAFKVVYFAKYLLFVGEAREDMLDWLLEGNRNILETGISILTVNVSIKYRAPLYAFDRIRITLTIPKLGRMKAHIHFEIRNDRTNELNAVGDMTIGTTMGDKLIEIPELIADRIKSTFLLGRP